MISHLSAALRKKIGAQGEERSGGRGKKEGRGSAKIPSKFPSLALVRRRRRQRRRLSKMQSKLEVKDGDVNEGKRGRKK